MTRVRGQVPNPGAYEDEWDSRVRCGWADCENPGSMLHHMVECYRAPGISSHSQRPRRVECAECRKVCFCSAQHHDFYQQRRSRAGAVGSLLPGTNPRYSTPGRR